MTLFKYTLATLVLTAAAALAGNAPWTMSAPQGTTAAHQQMAAQAAKVHAQVGANGFGRNPYSVEWNGSANRFQGSPLSNVSRSSLKQAITGRYHVYQDPGQTKWSVRYYGADGIIHFCRAGGRGNHQADKKHYAVTLSAFGLAGIRFWGLTLRKPTGDKATSWPLVVDSSTGEIAIFNYYRRH